MADIRISQLPTAPSAITGTELVPIVQNGLTVQTTVSAITQSPNQTQPFLTVSQQPTLPNSRALSAGVGIGITDGGAQSTYNLSLNGTSGSLETVSTGVIVKSAANTISARTLTASGNGISVTDGSGVAGDPTFQLTGLALAIANMSGTGLVGLNGSTFSPLTLVGDSNEITIANGNGAGGSPTIGIADNAVFPGLAGVTLPNGTTAERGATQGQIRYNTTNNRFEGNYSTGWQAFGIGDGSVTSVAGATNQIVVSTVGGVATVSIDPDPVIPGVGAIQIPAGATVDRPGGVNGQLRYNSSTATFEGYANGAWGAIVSGSGVTSVGTGVGLLGGPITSTGTIDIDTTVVATLSGTQTLTNKTISGASNTLSNIGNASLTNSAITIGSNSVSLGSTLSTLNGVSISGAANTLSSIGNSSLTNSSLTLGTTTVSLGATATSLAGLSSVAVTGNPTTALELTTKQYVDNIIASGVSYHTPVRLESPNTVGNLNATYNNGVAGVGATLTNAGTQVALTIDGVATVVADRVLIYNQTNAVQNGVYTVTNIGSGSTNWVLTRATDANTYGPGPNSIDEGSAFFVTSGNTGAGEIYVITTVGTITFGTTPITFAQIAAAQVYSAGTGLTLTGTQFSLTAPVTAALGGTGQTSYTSGDLIYASGATALSKLAAGTNGYLLTMNAGLPSWQPAPATGVTSFQTSLSGLTPSTSTTGAVTLAGTLGVANGGTGLTSVTANCLPYGNGTSALQTSANLTFNGTTLTNTGNAIISDSSANAALRITQTGAGNALLVEDSANPDASPFVVDANGKVAIGSTTAVENFNLISDGRNFLQLTRASTDSTQSVIAFRKARGTNAAPTIVSSGDFVGDNQYLAYDGTNYLTLASIQAVVDGTPGTNDMPGRLVFSTTPDGATVPLERMRIGNTGTISLGAAPGAESLRVTPVASAVNYWSFYGRAAGAAPYVLAEGSDTNIELLYSAKGAAGHVFYSSGLSFTPQFKVAHTASAVNYPQVTGGPTGSAVTYAANGADTNVGISYISKGAGFHFFYSSSAPQFGIANTGSSVNYLQVAGGATGNAATLSAQGSDTNINLALTPKGTGVVTINTTTAITVPAGTTAQRPTGATGMFRYNSTTAGFEGYNGTVWGAIGGGSNITALGLWENASVIAANYTIGAGNNATSAGPITINAGVVVTVPSGSTWSIV